MTAILVFVAQTANIFLHGFQQLNVVGKHYVSASATSLMLGVFGYYLIAAVAIHAEQPIGSAVWFAYIAAGPVGICVAMWAHPKLKRWSKTMTDGQTEVQDQQAADAKRIAYHRERWVARVEHLQHAAEQAAEDADHDALHMATIERVAIQRAMKDVFGEK